MHTLFQKHKVKKVIQETAVVVRTHVETAIIHKIFETNSSFYLKYRTTGKV